MDHLIMRSIINVHLDGHSQIETDLDFKTLENARHQIRERGYKCSIHRECGQLQFIVSRL